MRLASTVRKGVADPVPRAPSTPSRCADCGYRQDDRLAIETSVSGLAVFGSAYGASIGSSRLCLLHDRLVSPNDGCVRFIPIQALESRA